MNIVMVHVHVKPEHEEEFLVATLANREASIREPGNVRFDILQSKNDTCRFLLLEIYRTDEDAAAHKSTPHYLAWRDTVADWMASPREGVPYQAVAPVDASRW